MVFFIFMGVNEKLPKEKQQGAVFLFVCAVLFSILSWAVPICWLGERYFCYSRSIKKIIKEFDKRIKESK
jgi:hypothetical protein